MPPGYYCTGTGQLVEGRGTRHLQVGGAGIDAAVAEAFLAALQPAALQACLAAARQLEDGHDAALAQWRRQVEQARYEAGRAAARPKTLTPQDKTTILALGDDLPGVWTASITTDKDRKRLLRSLLDSALTGNGGNSLPPASTRVDT